MKQSLDIGRALDPILTHHRSLFDGKWEYEIHHAHIMLLLHARFTEELKTFSKL